MQDLITGIHHITSLASDAGRNDRFFTQVLGLRRVKTTVNFDRPDVYHLYYGNRLGEPGTVITYFPFPDKKPGIIGTGEVGRVVFSVPGQALGFWEKWLKDKDIETVLTEKFGARRLEFLGPDSEQLALVENNTDDRHPWTTNGLDETHAIRGFHSASLNVTDAAQMTELLRSMGFEQEARDGNTIRFATYSGTQANTIDIVELPDLASGVQGAGSVHHIAFRVRNRAAQLEVRKNLIAIGHAVTEVKDRNYFWAIYFRTADGILFEVATDEPGFAHDEEEARLGTALKLPQMHEHLREDLKSSLPPIDNCTF